MPIVKHQKEQDPANWRGLALSQMVSSLTCVNIDRGEHRIILSFERNLGAHQISGRSTSNNEGYDSELGDFSATLVLDEIDDLACDVHD
jgi:hypothetical protein